MTSVFTVEKNPQKGNPKEKPQTAWVDFYLACLACRVSPTPPVPPPSPGFAQALSQFRIQIETEGSDIEEVDFFADVRSDYQNFRGLQIENWFC